MALFTHGSTQPVRRHSAAHPQARYCPPAVLVTHGKESNEQIPTVPWAFWRASHFLPLFAPRRANGAVFAQNRRFDVAIYGEDVDERKVDRKNPPPSPTVYKTDT